MIENYESLFRATIGIFAIVPTLYVMYLQLKEYYQPKDGYTRLKLILLFLNLIFASTLLPSVIYQFMRAFGNESSTFRVVVTVIGGFGPLAMAIAWYLIYKYKVEE